MFSWVKKFLGTRRGKAVAAALVVALVPLFALAWWLGSPLFINKTVDEEFPRTASAVIPAGMSRADAEEQMEAAEKDPKEMSEAMPASLPAARPVSSGAFRDADSFHKGSGRAGIYTLPEGGHLLRLEDLRVTNGPDLHVFLSAGEDPRSRGAVRDGGFIDLGSLKGNIGNQNYNIPAGEEISKYRSVVIYCVPFNVIFSVAPLKPGQGG